MAGLLAAAALHGASPARAQASDAAAGTTPRLQVADPYLEMHTGPGRGYPVFHVAARGEWVELVLRHTDWVQVRTGKGITGWVPRRQLAGTLSQAGVERTWRDAVLDDVLAGRVEAGGAVGRLEGEPMLRAFVSARLGDAIRAEATLGQAQGAYSGTDFWHLNLHVDPWSGQRLSPSFGIGFGRFRNLPNASLVGIAATDVNLANVTLGLRWRLAERVALRADVALLTAYLDDRRSAEYRAVSAGLSFAF